ncbi:MAG: protein kinase domain-containing protein [bacterium]
MLLDKIAVGGMAELYRAKIRGIEGFEKLIAIKKIHPHLTADKNLISSFIDEAKLAALLQHQNIVQIYNFGSMEDAYFIAMEYLFGKDLRFIIKKSKQKGQPLNLENALYIASRICAGLDYAHNLKDFHGHSLNIIHRDIGPHNIFITFDGQIKIIDFGIAKAATQHTMTQVGSIKGKIAYMSPEQALGKSVDHRSDIFSIGIVLYEMVTYKQMFEGDNFEAYAKVREAKFEPPEKIKKNLPRKLHKILNKALAKEPERRYQSAEEMLIDLEMCISKLSFRPSDRTLSRYMKALFEDEANTEELAMCEAPPMDYEEELEVEEDNETSRVVINEVDMPEKRKGQRYLYITLATVLIALGMIFGIMMIENPVSKWVKKNADLANRHLFSDLSGITQPAEDSSVVQKDLVSSSGSFQSAGFPESVPLDPELTALLETANALIESEHFDEAIALFEDIMVNKPFMTEKILGPYSEALESQASKLIKTDQEEAKALLLKSIMLNPESVQGHYLLGRLYSKQKNNAGAIASYQKAVELNPQMTEAFFNLGYSYAINKDYIKAEEMYQRVIELSPPFLDEALFNLALVQVKLGNLQRGIENLEQAIEVNPENNQAKKLLQQLNQKAGQKG